MTAMQPWQLRSEFAQRLSVMYGAEVPAYTTLVDVSHEVNRDLLARRLRALGHEVFYIEDTGECVYDPVQNTRSTDPAYGTSYIHRALEPYGLGDCWSFINYDGTYHGRDADCVRRFCADADLFLNLSGGSWFWRDEYARIPRSAFIDSDPAFTQLAIAKAEPWDVEFFKRFDRLFTFGANIGTAASPVPVGEFVWHKTWQPVTVD